MHNKISATNPTQNGCNAYAIATYTDYATIARGLLSNTNVTFTGCMLLKEGHCTEQYATERRQLLINILATYLIVCYRITTICLLLI